jgi:ribosomal protein S27E
MKFIKTELLEINVIETNRSRFSIKCDGCGKTFRIGEKRIHWKLSSPHKNKYNASFWIVHCPTCAIYCTTRYAQELSNVNLTNFLPTSNHNEVITE